MPGTIQPEEQVRKFNPLTRFLGGLTGFILTGFVSTPLRLIFGGAAYVVGGISNMTRNTIGFVVGVLVQAAVWGFAGLMAVGALGIS